MSDTNLTLGVDLKLSELVDNLSAKLGVAVDKLEPLAKDTIDQYVLREIVYSCGLFFLASMFIFLAIVGFKMAKKADHDSGIETGGCFLCVLASIGVVIVIPKGLISLAHAFGPLPSILGL